MQPSISVSAFVDPKPGSREHNAILRAIEIQPAVHLVGTFEAAAGQERWYRVRARGRDRRCVILWYSKVSEEEVGSCNCEAFTIPVSGPTPCFHLSAALIYEAPKVASMGRKLKVRKAMDDTFRNYPVVPFRGQYFTAPSSSAKGSCTVADLLREIADWMESNQVEDPEFEELRLGITFSEGGDTDEFYYHATLYYRREGDKIAE